MKSWKWNFFARIIQMHKMIFKDKQLKETKKKMWEESIKNPKKCL